MLPPGHPPLSTALLTHSTAPATRSARGTQSSPPPTWSSPAARKVFKNRISAHHCHADRPFLRAHHWPCEKVQHPPQAQTALRGPASCPSPSPHSPPCSQAQHPSQFLEGSFPLPQALTCSSLSLEPSALFAWFGPIQAQLEGYLMTCPPSPDQALDVTAIQSLFLVRVCGVLGSMTRPQEVRVPAHFYLQAQLQGLALTKCLREKDQGRE